MFHFSLYGNHSSKCESYLIIQLSSSQGKKTNMRVTKHLPETAAEEETARPTISFPETTRVIQLLLNKSQQSRVVESADKLTHSRCISFTFITFFPVSRLKVTEG